MKATLSPIHTAAFQSRHVLLGCTAFVALLLVQVSSAHAQRSATTSYFTFLDEVGIVVNGTFVPGGEIAPDQLTDDPLLFENHTADHLPVFAPDGTTQLRYSDISNLNGTATIRDVGAQGTEVSVNIVGLIPGGLYSTWIDMYAAPGFTPDFAHELGLTALGYDANNPPANPQEYTGNVFRADENGHGEITGIQPPVPPSWFATGLVEDFEVPSYLLDPPVHQMFIAVAYHQDGNTWGPRPGIGEGLDALDETWVTYAGSSFSVPEPSTWILLSVSAVSVALTCLVSSRSMRSSQTAT